MAMDLIPALRRDIARTYAQLFFGPELRAQKPPVRMLRLYFGRNDIPPVTTQLHPGLHSDFPLDIPRYRKLADTLTASGTRLPRTQDISRGMGELLSRLHWGVGINARDVELVLPGADWEPQCWVFDLNQVGIRL
jgi:hypothetical protein